MSPQAGPAQLRPEWAEGMLAASPDCVKLLSHDGRVLYMNDRGLVLTEQASIADVLGRELASSWPEEERSRIAAAIAGAAAGAVTRIEGYCPTARGTPRWWEVSFAPLAAVPGTEPMIVGISRDISDRRATELALRESRARLAALERSVEARAAELTSDRGRIWQISPDLMGVLGADGIFESCNPAWQAVLGWSPEQISTTPFFDYVHADDLERSRAVFVAAVERGVPALRFENRYRTTSGAYRWLSWVAVPEGGKVYCVARDVTEAKARIRELAERQRERDLAWRLSQDLLVTAATDGTLLAVNPAWTRLLGWSEEQLVGRPFTDLTHPDDLPRTIEVFAGIAEQPLTTPYEYRLRHGDGSWRWFAWTAALEDDRVYANGRDTTERHEREEALRQVEAALRQSQKMEAVGQLTGGLAHDFNNLLAAITGSVQVTQRKLALGDTADIPRYLEMALGACRRAASLTHRLLAFSRRQALEPKALDLNRLIGEFAEMLRRSIGPSVELEFVAAPDLWTVVADPGQLENALLNVCLNARDAMPAGGRITVETANRRLDGAAAAGEGLQPGQYVSLCVADTGSGMSADVVGRAFDPFFTTKPLGSGTGLGLSMVYGFSQQSGGSARIRSEEGQGTTVCIHLPRNEADVDDGDDPAGAAGGDAARARDGETVLVVDDEPSLRAILVELMQEQGYVTLQAGDGAEALAILRREKRIDVLVTDVGLPGGLNGRQVADAARALKPALRVLFITGYAENAVLSDGRLDKGLHVMTKPFELDALVRRVRELVATPSG